MSINGLKDVLHRIHVKLYPSYLAHIQGKYFAKTSSEKILSVEEVCTAAKLRGGVTGSYEDMVSYVKIFFDECAYQLCDGFGVSNDYFSIHPNVRGMFEKVILGLLIGHYSLDFRFRIHGKLRDLADFIEVFVDGLAESGALIDEFLDVKSGLINERLTPGGQFVTTGNKIKVVGPSPLIGVYLTSPGTPAFAVQVVEALAVNEVHRIVGIIPELPPGKEWTLEIRTQYSGSSNFLKDVRTIAGEFKLTTA
jgi:hypothetical protein